MKKRIAALTTILALIFSASFAASANDNISPKILATFTEKFTSAKQVSWNKADNYLKASFILNDQYMFAYFDETGELMGLSRNIKSNQLPLSLESEFKKYQGAGWITELLEFSGQDETTYFATIENAGQIILIKSSGNSSWFIYKRIKKK